MSVPLPSSVYQLREQRSQWTAFIKERLEKANRQQKAVAIDINFLEGNKTIYQPAVSRFVQGDPDELKRWFEDHPKWIDILLQGMDLDRESLLGHLRRLGQGEKTPVRWNPAFPDVALEEAEIDTPLLDPRSTNPEAVVQRQLESFSPIVLIANPGRSRDIAVQQLMRKMSAALEVLMAKEKTEVGRLRRSRKKPIPTKVEATFEATAPTAVPATPDGVWMLCVYDEAENSGIAGLRLSLWGARQAATLARRIAALPGRASRNALLAFAERLEGEPWSLGGDLRPDLVIRLLAVVETHGAPKSGAEARALFTAAVWRRLSQGERLQHFDERLLEHLFAALAARERALTELGDWTCAPKAAVRAALGEAVAARQGEAAGRPLPSLVAKVKAARGAPSREVALKELEQALAGDPVNEILEELVVAGVFEAAGPPDRPHLRAVEATFAQIWAVRGLNELPPPGDGRRVLDPAWGHLIEEMGRQGRFLKQLLAAIDVLPEEVAIEGEVWLLQWAVSGAMPTSQIGRLSQAWATVAWAVGRGYLAIFRHGQWANTAMSVLERVSNRYGEQMGHLGVRPSVEVSAMVPLRAKERIEAWHGGLMEVQRVASRPSFEMWGDEHLDEVFRVCAPGRVGPRTLEDWAEDPFRSGVDAIRLGAAQGDRTCIDLISGKAWLDHAVGPRVPNESVADLERVKNARRIWMEFSDAEHLTFALKGGLEGEAAALVFALVAEKIAEDMLPQLLSLGDRAGSDAMAAFVVSVFKNEINGAQCQQPRKLTLPLAWTLAERLKMTDLLEVLTLRPQAMWDAAQARVDGIAGEVVLDNRGLPSWPQNPSPFFNEFRVSLDQKCKTIEVPNEYTLVHFDIGTCWMRWEGLAQMAAEVLYRLGRPAALRRRWREGGATIPQALLRHLDRLETLFYLLYCPPGSWGPSETNIVPWHALANVAKGKQDDTGFHRFRYVYQCAVDRIEAIGTSWVDPTLLQALQGVWLLFVAFPEAIDPSIAAFLDGLARIRVPRPINGDGVGRPQQRSALFLAEQCDPELLACWATAQHLSPTSGPTERAAVEAIRGHMELASDGWLARAWEVFQKGISHWPEVEGKQEARTLLRIGSRRRGPAGGPQRDDPCSFVVKEAMLTQDDELFERLNQRNQESVSWIPVLDQAFQVATDNRSKAYLALRLHKLRPFAPRVVLDQCLEYWMLEDSDPFSGGPDFDANWEWGELGRRHIGGVQELLAAALDAKGEWVSKGLQRLWNLAICLPNKGEAPIQVPAYFGAYVFDPQVEALPPLLVQLKDALFARGLHAVVIGTWKNPPDHLPTRPGYRSRAAALRRWLTPTWASQATAEELEDYLLGPEPYDHRVLSELLRRGWTDMRRFGERMAAHPASSYQFLARSAPDQIMPAVDARIRKLAEGEGGGEANYASVASIAELVDALEDASQPGWECPAVLLALRRALLRSVDPRPGG
jgi:hypothetical protein